MSFDAKTLTAPAGSTVVMTFVTGPKTITYTFTVPSQPGNYFFRCDIHPEVMTDTFVVT
jgi:plastocyanin